MAAGFCSKLVLMLLLCAETVSSEHTSERTLEDVEYRQAQDLGSIMADVKTILMMLHQHTVQQQNGATEDKEQESEQGDKVTVQGGCAGNMSGLSTLYVQQSSLPVPCDGQGGIVILRRVNNEHNFPDRGWEDYKNGFGNPTESFWLGLEHMHRLSTARGSARLRVELEAWDGERRWAEYSYMRIEAESSGYRLMLDGYTGNAGDSLSYHSGQKFTTNDRDNDEHDGRNCAKSYGGWWFKSWFRSLLTAMYISNGVDVPGWQGIIWKGWKGESYSYAKAEMKLFLN